MICLPVGLSLCLCRYCCVPPDSLPPSPSHPLVFHGSPVWQVAWAHPKFGVLLASCSFDGKVIIHRESQPGVWSPIHEQAWHKSSVNSVAWAPHEYGLILGCASADGYVSILKHMPDDSWEMTPLEDGKLGCNSISWAPVTSIVSNLMPNNGLPPMKFVTGSCDNNVRLWEQRPDGSWPTEAKKLPAKHEDWVRDVAWGPNSSGPSSIVASCSEDRRVIIWTQSDPAGEWEAKDLCEKFAAPVWRVSWSVTGNLLAVSCGDHTVTLWKQSLSGDWTKVSDVTDDGAQEEKAN